MAWSHAMPIAALLSAALIAADPAAGAEAAFLEQLRAAGPVEMTVAQGMQAPDPRARARLSMPDAMTLDLDAGPRRDRLAFEPPASGHPGLRARWTGPDASLDAPLDPDGWRCRAEVGPEGQLAVDCWSPRDERSAAMRPPSLVFEIFPAADGPRAVRTAAGGRTVYSPVAARAHGAAWLAPGVPSVLGDALAQLAEAGEGEARGRMFGGSSGGGDWYSSELRVGAVSGLDFQLARATPGDRAGDHRVPVAWSFDYQGLKPGDPGVLVWHVVRRRPGAPDRDLWCLGREAAAVVQVDCHAGPRLKPANADQARAAVTFRLSPYPNWTINVGTGTDEAFSTAGTSRPATRPYP
jgi:hypothetical protein